jgi:hypothetical protein
MLKHWIGAASSKFVKGRPGFRPEAIVIHIMEGTLIGTGAWFNNPASKVSAHYGIGKNGQVNVYVSEPDTAFHAGIIDNASWTLIKANVNPNYYTVGIEHEGRANDDWPDSQYEASAELIAEIGQRWKIQLDRKHIIGHREIRASKTCPGSGVDLDALIARARRAQLNVFKPFRVAISKNANLREAAPSTTAKVVRVVGKGSTFDVVDFTDVGERIDGNPYWFADSQGNFVWAGCTDQPTPTAWG